MIKKLTDEQTNLIDEIRDEWLGRYFGLSQDLTWQKAKPHIKWLYEFCGLKEPLVIVVDSPMAAQYAANLLNSQISTQVSAQIHNQIRAQIRDQIHNQIHDQIHNQIHNQISDQIRDQISDQVREQVREQVNDQVWFQIRSRVKGEIIKMFSFDWIGSMVSDIGWVSYYDFFDRIGVTTSNNFKKYREFVKLPIFTSIQMEGVCILVKMPQYDRRGINSQKHCTDDYSIKWADGYGQHYVENVFFDIELFNKIFINSPNLTDILNIRNVEQRRVALKYRGQELLAQDSEILHTTTRGNELLRSKIKIENADNNIYMLRFSCPSTGRVYIEFVDPKTAEKNYDADECQAYALGLTPEEYSNLEIET